ncbi:hypothetical protein [Larkinella sp. C7]|uniref:hypothetical protein n=1 Tax=Larkinella sp. C7 TaxID=2576607 RepID=UPI0011115CC1|nr:hypothetical protein [Larkinella sp. C7]
MAWVITKLGKTIKAVDGSDVRVFTNPVFLLFAAAVFPTVPVPCVEISQGGKSLQLTGASITTIDGAAPAGSLAGILDQLLVTPAGNTSAQTAATGTNYTTFASQVCSQLTLFNNTAAAIDVQQGGAGAAVSVPVGASFTFVGITNANQLGVRRTDTSNTQVTVGARWQA